MLRLVIGGRFGNQLIQYAAVRAQAKRLGVELEIDLQFCDPHSGGDSFSFWLDTLPIKARILDYPASGPRSAHGVFQRGYRKLIRPLLWKCYAQPVWRDDDRFFAIRPWTVITGYFQSLFYLQPRDEEILAELNPQQLATAEIKEYVRSITSRICVSVHVRRGDAVRRQGESDTLPVWQSSHLAYYDNAIDLMRRKLTHPTFLVFSDDVEWCKQSGIFRRDCEFVETDKFGDNPAFDLLLMSSCSHHIIANSTYSWWAAWAALNDEKICILPEKWTPKDKTAALGLVHQNWITL